MANPPVFTSCRGCFSWELLGGKLGYIMCRTQKRPATIFFMCIHVSENQKMLWNTQNGSTFIEHDRLIAGWNMFDFSIYRNIHPNWLIFFRGLKTNQQKTQIKNSRFAADGPNSSGQPQTPAQTLQVSREMPAAGLHSPCRLQPPTIKYQLEFQKMYSTRKCISKISWWPCALYWRPLVEHRLPGYPFFLGQTQPLKTNFPPRPFVSCPSFCWKSLFGCFLKLGDPQIIHFKRVYRLPLNYKASILKFCGINILKETPRKLLLK